MASTENKLEFKTGEADVATAGTAVALASSTTLVRNVIIQGKDDITSDNEVVVGDVNVVGASGATRRGVGLAANETLTINAESVEGLGLRGARQGDRFIDMSELYIDCAAARTDGASWFGYA